MKKYLFLLFLAATIIWACGGNGKPAKTTISEDGAVTMSFGDEITADGAIPLSEMVNKLNGKDTVFTKVSGVVESVCKKKGCWMNIVNDNGDEVFVKFKDYGFFMPLDCEGAKVVMDGFATVEETSVEELRHYAEDEGKSKEEIAAITEPVKEMKFMAHGVVMTE